MKYTVEVGARYHNFKGREDRIVHRLDHGKKRRSRPDNYQVETRREVPLPKYIPTIGRVWTFE